MIVRPAEIAMGFRRLLHAVGGGQFRHARHERAVPARSPDRQRRSRLSSKAAPPRPSAPGQLVRDHGRRGPIAGVGQRLGAGRERRCPGDRQGESGGRHRPGRESRRTSRMRRVACRECRTVLSCRWSPKAPPATASLRLRSPSNSIGVNLVHRVRLQIGRWCVGRTSCGSAVHAVESCPCRIGGTGRRRGPESMRERAVAYLRPHARG